MSVTNATIRKRIADLEKEREGMSYGSIDYPRITAEIHALALQLKPEPHWSTTPGFWVAVVAMVAACVAAYPVLFQSKPNAVSVPQSQNDSSKSKMPSPLSQPSSKK